MAFPSTPLSTLAGSPYPIHALTYSASPGSYILTGSSDKAIRLYNPFPPTSGSKGSIKAGKLVQKFEAHGYEVLDICVAKFVLLLSFLLTSALLTTGRVVIMRNLDRKSVV